MARMKMPDGRCGIWRCRIEANCCNKVAFICDLCFLPKYFTPRTVSFQSTVLLEILFRAENLPNSEGTNCIWAPLMTFRSLKSTSFHCNIFQNLAGLEKVQYNGVLFPRFIVLFMSAIENILYRLLTNKMEVLQRHDCGLRQHSLVS